MRTTRLADKVKIVNTVVPTAGAAAGMTETEIDCRGFSRVMYVLITGAAAANATIAFKIQHAAATGMAGAADITSAASAGLTAAANASKIHVYDIAVNPDKPFQIPVGVVGADTFANACIAILYQPTGGNIKYPVSSAYATELVTLDTSVNA